MRQKLYLFLCCFVWMSLPKALAQYVAPSEGVFRIVNVEYNAAMTEDFINGTLRCTEKGADTDYEQLWKLIPSGNKYYIQNVFTGRYIQTGNSGTEVPYWTGKTPKEFTIVKNQNWTGYNIWDTGLSGDQGLHSKGGTGNIVRWWSESSKAASEWQFVSVEVTEEQIAAAQATFAEFSSVQENTDVYEAALKDVFEDAACTVLKAQYASMGDDDLRAALAAMELPSTLVEMAVKVKNDSWGEPNEKSDKPSWDSDYAKKFRVQLIEPYSIAGEITSWFGYNAHTNMDNPVGIYLNKLQVAYIMVEGEIADGAELWVTYINGHGKMPNYNNGYSNGIRLKSGLNVVPFGIDGSALFFNYLVHTYDTSKKIFTNKLGDYDDLKIHVEGGYINGYYNAHGDALYTADTDADWVYYEERANMENITILGRHQVLQFNLNDVTENGVTDRGLRKLFPEELPASLPANQRINAIVEAWDRIMLSELITLGVASKEMVDSMNAIYPRWDATWKNKAEMYDYEGYAEFCEGRDYSDYYNHHGLAFGVGGNSYMYGSWDHCGYHRNTTPSILTKIATESGPTWGPAHEIGHQHQGLFTVNGLTEVTNNLFSNIAVWYMGMGTSRVNATEGNLPHVYDVFKAGGDFFDNNIWALTQMYYRLWLYYHRAGNDTQFYPKLFELLRRNPISKGYYQQGKTSILHFYQLCCEAAQEDLTEFFRAYGFFRVMNNRLVGDYSNSEYTQSQADIDAAIAAVKAKGYPVNNKPIFINDCTPDVTYSHDGTTRRSYWDNASKNGVNGEIGSYVMFVNPDATINGNYIYSLNDDRISVSGGEGAAGFALYNQEDEILAFSNHHTFSLSEEVLSMLRSGEATVVAVSPVGEDVVVLSKAEGGTEEEQLQALTSAISAAKDILGLSDDKGINVGYFKPAYLVDLQTLVSEAEAAKDNKDTSVFTYGQWSMLLEQAVMALIEDPEAHVPLYQEDYYALGSVANKNTSLEYSTAGLKVTFAAPEENAKKQWQFVPADTEGQYFLKNVETGLFVSLVNEGVRVKVAAETEEEAVAFNLIQADPSYFYLQSAENKSLYLSCDSKKNVIAANGEQASGRWTITSVVDNHSETIKTNLEMLLKMVSFTMDALVEATEPELKFYEDVTVLDEQLPAYVTELQEASDEAYQAIENGYAYLEDYIEEIDYLHELVKVSYRKALTLPEATTEDEVMCYYIQCLDTEAYAYAYEGSGRYNGSLKTSELTDASDSKFWFYLRPGETDGQYYIYNWQTGKAAGNSGRYVYVNGTADQTSFTISVSEEDYGYTISTSDGMWNVQSSTNGYVQFASKPAMWMLVPIGKFSTTGIAPLSPVQTDDIYYDLLGRPVKNPTSGIYIHAGRKVVIE